jgi:hypothetical protein
VLAALVTAGCATSQLNASRQNYYLRTFEHAAENLAEIPADDHSRALYLMERGMVQQALRDYEASVTDWNEAAELIERLDYYSVSRGSASFVVNDRMLPFRGAPFERTLMHSFAAQSYLAMGLWDDAAVEARRIVRRQQDLNGYPDDAYSHYVAGFCFEMIGDMEGAAFEYRKTDELLEALAVGEYTGVIGPATASSNAPPEIDGPCELVCFIGIGRAPAVDGGNRDGRWGGAPYAEISSNGRSLGRSYTLATTGTLRAKTEERTAALRAAKTAARVVVKESIADAVEEQNDLFGELLRLALLAMELPDDRRWATLPMWLQVARVPCNEGLESYTVDIKRADGTVLESRVVEQPLTRRGRVYVSLYRAP